MASVRQKAKWDRCLAHDEQQENPIHERKQVKFENWFRNQEQKQLVQFFMERCRFLLLYTKSRPIYVVRRLLFFAQRFFATKHITDEAQALFTLLLNTRKTVI